MYQLTFEKMCKLAKQNNVYMIIGNGTKNQFRNMKKVNSMMDDILENLPPESCFLYFGDYPDEKNPDVGYLFKLLKEKRADLKIFMIQISEAKSWGVPDFVDYVHWHDDFSKIYKWGGLDDKREPCSNTKKWAELNIQHPITKVFVFGGGQVTIDEVSLLKRYNVPYKYFSVERKYAGDGKTEIKSTDDMENKIGATYNLNFAS